MANYYGSARSNYFKVKDESAFSAWISKYNIETYKNAETGMICMLCNNEDGCWPSDLYDEEAGDYVDVDFVQELSEHLALGYVAVLMYVGHEKMRYLAGGAMAVSHTGDTVYLDLDNIYNLAEEKFGNGSVITRCEY